MFEFQKLRIYNEIPNHKTQRGNVHFINSFLDVLEMDKRYVFQKILTTEISESFYFIMLYFTALVSADISKAGNQNHDTVNVLGISTPH